MSTESRDLGVAAVPAAPATSGHRIGRREVPYPTTVFTEERVVGSHGIVRVALGEVHGKVLGTDLTLCGRAAASWFKFHGQRFVDQALRCRACDEALARDR